MDAHRIAIEEEEFLVDVFKAVVFVVDGPFGIAIVFLAVGAAVVIDVAFEAGAFLVALVPFAAEGTRLNAGTAIAFFVQLVIDNNVIHLQVLDLIVDVHEDDVGFDVLGALAGEVHVFVGFQECLLQIDVDGVRDFAFLDFVKRFLGRHADNFVAFLDGVSELVADVVQALLHVNVDGIRAARNKVRTDAHVPFVRGVFGVLVEFAERVLARTVNEDHVDVKFRHEGFFLVESTAQAPELGIQAEYFGKGLVAIERGQERIVTGILFLQQFGIRRFDIHVVERITRHGRERRRGKQRA